MPANAPLPNGVALDLAGERLRASDGSMIDLRPQAFATLRYLIAHPNRVVSKEELLAAVWGGAAVTDDSLVQCIHEIRRAVGDADRAIVQTVSRRGYRLALLDPDAGAPTRGAAIAVIAFETRGEDGLRRFASDLAEELIACLSRFPDTGVAAATATVADPGGGDLRAVAAMLGVGYLLGGAVRRDGARLRIVARLVDGASGRLLWSGRFEGEPEDDTDLQDSLAQRIAGFAEASLRRAEIARARRRPLDGIAAHDFYLRALPHAFANTADGCETALRLLGKALEESPDHLAAHGYAAWCREQRYLRRGFDPSDRSAALDHAARTMGANADDGVAMSMGAFVQANLTKDYDFALEFIDRALALSCGSALACGFAALVAAHGERPDLAREHALEALRLGPPDDPLNYHPCCALTVANLFEGRDLEAVDWAARTSRANPGFSVPYAYRAAAAARLGDMDAARRDAARLLEAEPAFTVRGFAGMGIFRRELAGALAEDLRRAGLPEGDGPRTS